MLKEQGRDMQTSVDDSGIFTEVSRSTQASPGPRWSPSQGIYNTPGVCHQLSNGFELKHGMLSGDEGVKIKSTRVSSN